MATTKADVSVEHLSWLVPARMSNEDASLKLYKAIDKHRAVLSLDINRDSQVITNLLAGTCFALWRAVFLADNDSNGEAYMTDTYSFLGNLIANNTVGYVQDRNDRNFTFIFYIQTARHRLINLAEHEKFKHLVSVKKIDEVADKSDVTPKEIWTTLQGALSNAINLFAVVLDEDAKKIAKQIG